MQWFKNRKTLTKLMLAFCLTSVCVAVVGYEGITAANTINDMNDSLYSRDMLGLSAIKQANVQLARIGRETRAAILTTEPGEIEQLNRVLESEFDELDDSLSAAEKTLISERAKENIAKIKELRPQYDARIQEILRLAAANKDQEATAALKGAKSLSDQISNGVDSIVQMKEELGKQTADQCTAIYLRLRTTLLICMIAAIFLALGIGYFIAKLIAKPLIAAVNTLDEVAEGDLTVSLDVQSTDEVGHMAESLNHTIEAMRKALTEVRNSAESMTTSSQELASASEELASGAQEQASSLEETTATLEEITSAVKQNADNAKQASQVASGSRDTAEEGGVVVSEAITAMGQINEASNNIAEIITTIDEIAFQTNLLALNAAVEAARAGEQGRGFAVVATEVRNLAQRSATSAKEIKRLIQDSVRKVENGSSLVNKSGETLHQIVDSVKRVTDIVAEIASASREQSVGIEQVNKAMVQMDQVTQTNSSQTEELSATAQSLATHSSQLQALVQRFKVDRDRQTHSTVAPKATPAASHISSHSLMVSPLLKVKPNGHDPIDANAFAEF